MTRQVPLLPLFAPEGQDHLVGAVLTTYALDLSFVEQTLLPQLLHVSSDPDDAGRFVTDLRAALQRVEVHVIADGGMKPDRRLLWDWSLHVVGAPTFHPKVQLLVFDRLVRVLVGSANLTEPGFRWNAEAFARIDVRPDGRGAALAPLVEAVCDWLDAVGSERDFERSGVSEVVARARERVRSWAAGRPHSEDASFVTTGPAARTLTDLLRWTRRHIGPLTEVGVVTPFFEGDKAALESSPFGEVLKELAEGGRLAVFAPGEIREDGSGIVTAPPRILTALRKRCAARGVTFTLAIVPPRWPLPAAKEDAPTVARALHAKLLLLRGPRGCVLYVGSANFTAAALGTARGARNTEAGVAVRLAELPADLLPPATPVSLDALTLRAPEPIGEGAWFPSFLRAVVHDARAETLALHVVPDQVPDRWSLSYEGRALPLGAPDGDGRVRTIPAFVLGHDPDVEVAVPHEASYRYPIVVHNRACAFRDDALRALTLDDLLRYYAGEYRSVRELLRVVRARGPVGGRPGAGVAAPAGGDGVRAFVRALDGIEAVLLEPARSREDFLARIHGPVGVARLVAALTESRETGGAPDEGRGDACDRLFRTLETSRALARVAARLTDDEVSAAAKGEELAPLRASLAVAAAATVAAAGDEDRPDFHGVWSIYRDADFLD